MAGIPIPTEEPTEIAAGDTVKWERSFSDYSASSSWQLSYVVRGKATYSLAFNTEITADGSDFSVVIPASTTATWAAGDYTLFGYLTKSGERVQIYKGALTVTPNHASVTAEFDPRTQVQRTLDAINDMLEGTASREEMSYTVTHGPVTQSLSLFSRTELISLQKHYMRLRADEIAAENVANGKATGRKVYFKFT